MISPVPQDIISLILEQFLFDDTSALQSCALVSRSFLTPSQKGLFHTIHLDHIRQAKQHRRNLHQVFLQNPKLLKYVQELFVLVYGSDPSVQMQPHYWWAPDSEETLHAILNMLPDLRLLSLIFCDFGAVPGWNTLSVELKIAIERVFTLPSLAVCKLEGIKNFPTGCFRASEHLKELSLVNASFAHEQPGMIPPTTDLKLRSLESLTLSEPLNPYITLEAMKASIDMSRLRNADVTSCYPSVVWETIKDSAGSLDVLEWNLLGHKRPFDAKNMDMTAFKALRVLHLTAEFKLPDPTIGVVSWLLRSLESMSRVSEGSIKLEEVSVCFICLEPAAVESGVLQVARCLWDFNTVLTASERFSKLHKLVIYICSFDEVDFWQPIRTSLEYHFPGLSTHKVLSVVLTT